MLRAVIFDMDGVLVDTEPMHAQAFVDAMAEFGVSITTEYNYRFIGSTELKMCESIIEEMNLSISPTDIIAANTRAKRNLVEKNGYIPVPYTKDLIKNLYQNGVKLAIASSSSIRDIKSVTKALGISKYFDHIISGTTLPHSKPAPDIFLKALKELGANPNETIIIEDSMNGVLAAKAAGIACIGYINENSGNQDLGSAFSLIESFESVNYYYLNMILQRANNQPVTIATSKRLIIRELSIDDIKDLYEIYRSPKVKEYIDDIDEYLENEIEKHKAYIKNVYSFYGYGLWGVFNKESNKLIGRCGIQNRKINGHNEVELGYLLDANHWGYGYAIECASHSIKHVFSNLDIPRIVAVIDKQNERSIKVAKHIGMTLESEIMDRNRECYLYVIHKADE